MATKATNQALIDAIQDAGSNTAAEARAAWNGLLGELYPNISTQTALTTNILTRTGGLSTDIVYNINIKKSGNTVQMSGYVQNNANMTLGGLISTTPIILFADNAYKPKTGLQFYTGAQSGSNSKLRLNENGIFINYVLAPLEIIYLNLTYTTND